MKQLEQKKRQYFVGKHQQGLLNQSNDRGAAAEAKSALYSAQDSLVGRSRSVYRDKGASKEKLSAAKEPSADYGQTQPSTSQLPTESLNSSAYRTQTQGSE